MSSQSKVESNLAKLAAIKEKNPSATHIYMRRCDKDGLVVDIPISHAEFTIRNKPAWELVASNKQMDDAVEQLFKEPTPEPESKPADPVSIPVPEPKQESAPVLDVPPKPSESKPASKRNATTRSKPKTKK